MSSIPPIAFSRPLAALLALACWIQTAHGGTKGSMINTFGRGVAVNTVVYNGVTNTAKSALTQNPSSAVYDFDYGLEGLPDDTVATSLPDGTPKEIFSRSLGTAPGVWTWDAFVMDGATADNPALTAKLPVTPAGFARYDVKSRAFVDGTNKIGYLALEGFATKGAGVWLRAIEFKGTGEPRDIEDLETNGTLKCEITLAGPFFFDPTNCTDIKIPFTFQGNEDKVFFVADGVALSVPFTLSSPDLNGQCGIPVNYPAPAVEGGSGTNTVSYSIPSGSLFGYGETVVTMVVTDAAFDIKKTNTFKVTVTDTEPPALTCPEPIVQSTAPGQCLALVSVVPPVATDNCGAAVGGVRSDELPLNAAYPKGVTTITWTATDAAGNSTNCTQTITVVDTEKPVITCPVSITASTGPDGCSAMVSVTQATATDNCSGIITITGVRGDELALGAAYPKGVTTITWKATDAAGNSSTCIQTVTVNDTVLPMAKAKPATVLLDAHGNASITAAQLNDGSTDNCGIQSITISKTSFNCSNLGPNSVTLTVTDTSGNVSSATTTVTLLDNIAPVPNAFAATVTGNCSTPVSLPLLSALDNCSGVVTGTTPTRVFSASGTYSVPWTFRDASGNTTIVTQTVVVAGVQFIGPSSPFSPQNDSCSTPFSSNKRTIPFKFDLKCGNTYITSGPAPTVLIQKLANCNDLSPVTIFTGSAYFQNEWHFNWTTPTQRGLYKVSFLHGGTAVKSVFIQLN